MVTVDGKAREWNTNTGQLVGKPITADKAIYDATFSPAGDMIATVEYDPANPDKVSRYNSVRLWKTDTHEQIGEPITTPTRITDIAFSRRGDRLATATTDRQIQVWDTASKNRIGRPLTALHRIRAVAFSPLDPRLSSLLKTSRMNLSKWRKED